MFTRRPRSARELVSKAGRLPLLAVLGLLTLPSSVWAQPPAVPAPRDPMKVEKPATDDKGKAKVSVSEHMTVDLHLKDEDLANVLELLSIQTQKNIVASSIAIVRYSMCSALICPNSWPMTSSRSVSLSRSTRDVVGVMRDDGAVTVPHRGLRAEHSSSSPAPRD